MTEDDAGRPGRPEDRSWEPRPSYGTAAETIQVIAYKIDRMERDLAYVRVELREEIRTTIKDMKDKIIDIEERIVEPFRLKAVEGVVYGFVSIILIAVTYALLSGHIVASAPVPGVH